jgi:acyl-CoA reductase-like NAD-dependent aldehyde dehydrogenase
MANVRFARTVREHTAEAIAAGARPLIERQNYPADDGGAYLMPQVLVNVDHSMRVMKEESFGPVVGIMPVRGDDEALALMNDSPYGLTASIWSRDPERAYRVGSRVETGTVFLNRADYIDPAVCWTGCKDTGRGGAMSVLGYRAVTRPRSYHFRKVKA